jgi:hypothetical protein
MPHNPQPFHVPAGETYALTVQVIKKFDSFRWTNETQKALDSLKALISKPPVLASLESAETLLLYVTTTTEVISAAPCGGTGGSRHVHKVQ